jgi:hypothetical protein
MVNTILIILVIAVTVLTVELRDLRMKLRSERVERNELEHDLEKLTELSDNKGVLPVTQPELMRPDSVKCSFNIIRLICLCAEDGKGRKGGSHD